MVFDGRLCLYMRKSEECGDGVFGFEYNFNF